jgi:hypothetical protein
MVALGLIIMTVATAPMFNSAWGAAIGWIWATAFLAWPNFALDRVAAWREGPPTDDVSLVLVEVL